MDGTAATATVANHPMKHERTNPRSPAVLRDMYAISLPSRYCEQKTPHTPPCSKLKT
jgi:hypothetical protein